MKFVQAILHVTPWIKSFRHGFVLLKSASIIFVTLQIGLPCNESEWFSLMKTSVSVGIHALSNSHIAITTCASKQPLFLWCAISIETVVLSSVTVGRTHAVRIFTNPPNPCDKYKELNSYRNWFIIHSAGYSICYLSIVIIHVTKPLATVNKL